MKSYFRPEIDNMGGYTPGEQPKMANLLKLNTNESPYPPAPSVAETLKNFDCEKLRLYPDPTADEVREIWTPENAGGRKDEKQAWYFRKLLGEHLEEVP